MTVRTQPDAVPPTALVPPCALAGLWAVRHGQSTANVAFAAAEESGATGPVPGRDRDVPLSALGEAEILDPEEARAWRTHKADTRAFLLLRAYIPRAVRVLVTDPQDPTPYLYLSTREPERLVEALKAAKTAA